MFTEHPKLLACDSIGPKERDPRLLILRTPKQIHLYVPKWSYWSKFKFEKSHWPNLSFWKVKSHWLSNPNQ